MPYRSYLTGIVLLIAAGCSRGLPDLPRLNVANFRAQIRDQVQQTYQAARSKPNDADATGHLGMLLHALEQYEAAEQCYRRARLLDPNRFQWAYYLGLIQNIDGKNDQAAENLQAAVRMDEGYLPAQMKLAEVLLTLGRHRESEQVCQKMIQTNSQFAPAYYWSGRVAMAQGDVGGAIQRYEKACMLWPGYGTAHYALAQAYQKEKRSEQAQVHMTAYRKYKADSDPQPEDKFLEQVRALDNSALAHLMNGVDLENAGQFDRAIAEHEEAVRQDPKLVQAHANLIALYARTGQPAKAEAEYRATVALNPNLPQSHYDYGVCLASQGRWAEAEAAFRKALESSPGYPEAHSNLGAMLERRGAFEEAAQQYREALTNRPNYRQAHFQLGRLLMLRKKTTEAIAELAQSVTEEDADTPRFMYALGVAYAQAGDAVNARHYLEEAGQRAQARGQMPLAAQIEGSLRRVGSR